MHTALRYELFASFFVHACLAFFSLSLFSLIVFWEGMARRRAAADEPANMDNERRSSSMIQTIRSRHLTILVHASQTSRFFITSCAHLPGMPRCIADSAYLFASHSLLPSSLLHSSHSTCISLLFSFSLLSFPFLSALLALFPSLSSACGLEIRVIIQKCGTSLKPASASASRQTNQHLYMKPCSASE